MAEAQQVDYASLADQARKAAPVDYAALAEQARTAVPLFRQTDTTPNEVDPNTIGTAAEHFAKGVNPVAIGQVLPFPKAAGGSGMDNAFLPSNVVKAMHAVKEEGDARWAKGDHVGAIAKYVESIIPIAGPGMSHLGNQLQEGKYAAASGDVGALITNILLGKVAGGASAAPKIAAPVADDAVAFAKARDIPLDAATVSDNLAVKGTQALADRSLGGSVVATRANAVQAEAMTRVGGELADETGAAATTPEQAGASLRTALTAKMQGHAQDANQAYDAVRTFEQDPTNRMSMPLKPQAVDAIAEGQKAQLRRIVHELDAAPFTPRLLKPSAKGGGLEPVEGTGGAGAKVFDDIVSRMGGTSTPTRGVVQSQLETYLGGGPETNIVKAALEVGKARGRGQGGSAVSLPELPASAMPTRLEAERVTSEEMGLPVDLSGPKAALRPVYEQMKRQMPLTQQQASPGLKALDNILTGPDYAPLSQIDRDLGAIKKVAREQGGLAKMAVSKLEAAVTTAAKNGSPEVWAALKKGREATVAKYATSDVLESLNAEPVKTIKALTAPKDAAIEQLRTVVSHVPEQASEIARGYLEDLLDKPNKVAEWNKLGAETRALLFPKPGQARALNHFFELTKRISDTNVNPSGSGYVAALGAQGAMLWYDSIHAAEIQITGAALSKLLRSPLAVNALTRGLTLPKAAPVAVRAAATANLVRAAQAAGVTLDLPKAAEAPPNPARQP